MLKALAESPLIFARALADTTLGREKAVTEAYKELVDDYQAKNLITQEDNSALSYLYEDLNEMPLVKVTEEVAKAQITYEETEGKI